MLSLVVGSRWVAAPSVPLSVTAWPVAQTIAGIARQPEVQGRLYSTMFLIVGLVEAMYFINLAFAALFVFVLATG